MRLIYHPEAEAEVVEAARFYESKVATLGTQFLDAVDQAIRIILQDPNRCRILEQDIRHYLMPRFPYAVYYRVLADQIRILAFKHHSRHPDYWRHRSAD